MKKSLKQNIFFFFFRFWYNFVPERKKKEELSRDLSVGCPNPTQDRQHFRIPDENYMSTFQFADFAPDKIQFQITSEISQGLWTKTSNFDGIAVGGSSNGNTYHPPHRPALIFLFLDFYWNRIKAAKISWNINQDHQLLSCRWLKISSFDKSAKSLQTLWRIWLTTGTFDLLVFHSGGYEEILTLIGFEVCLSRLKLALKVMSE